ncbi:protein GAMETOPHYTE DEFECTIVE 1 isoform X2 [Physcomitrium patens]|uniref:Uncharacterized protein n=1 Tax=Physcomitrium patens TaxID=3218 RepID=A0A7I4CFU8_PHYPA|nr:ribonuclease P protein subunit p30-like isoform X2 [Physcomitrium patens]|eukprot:XP_024362991.1 ribonuclease P protein subunit p30-like isoform X2 [Physcomitrella patens]
MFHDLSLGEVEIGGNTRRELVTTVLQYGYTSVATDYVHSGPLAETDRSSIKPLDVSGLLSASSGIAESVKFHQKLLGVPADQPFRQYSRITVVVDDSAQAAALNSGNSVLRTYDIVAVRPTNQKVFEQACRNSEVDLISVDLFQRVPFRMKVPMVKAALQRGVFFEISYGRALFDARARKDLFSNAQVLQAATKGKGIVISSGASQAMELRGPNDVVNMATLFGLSTEFAKAAISKNCESVILHGVARKQAHKAAIILERVPAVSKEFLFAVPNVWDPLSVGTAKGSCLNLSPFVDAACKRDSVAESATKPENNEMKQKPGSCTKPDEGNQVENLNQKGSILSSTSKDTEAAFIPMVKLTSEWTEVGKKKGKKAKDKRPKGSPQVNKDTKKRKFN